jgi:hypothetical protein
MEGAMSKGFRRTEKALLDARILRASALAGRGDHVQAAKEALAVARKENLNSMNLYNLACTLLRASTAADRDTNLSPADRTRLKAQYADQAMDFLRQAAAKGWRNLDVIKKDTDIDALRAREDFQKLLADLEAKTKD